MKKKIKLLIVEPVSDMAGVSQYILALVRYLSKDKFDIHFGASGRGPLIDVLEKEGLQAHDLLIDYSALSFFPAILKLRIFFKKENFNIIHAHTARAGLLCSLANWGLGGKIVYSGHGLRFDQKDSFLSRKIFFYLEKFICWKVDFVTLLSDSEYDLSLKNKLFKQNKAKVISMTIDADKFSNVSLNDSMTQRKKWNILDYSFMVGMVGRIAFQKDPETFINTAKILKSKINNIYFVWVGDGDMKEGMISLAKNAGVYDRLIITGQQESKNMPLFLQMIDVLLFTSRFEGLPISLLEAMAAKKLIVAADVGSVSDVIKNGKTGWIFKSGDYQMASEIIENIYINKEKYSDIGKNAFDLVAEKYSPAKKISKEFENVFIKTL